MTEQAANRRIDYLIGAVGADQFLTEHAGAINILCGSWRSIRKRSCACITPASLIKSVCQA